MKPWAASPMNSGLLALLTLVPTLAVQAQEPGAAEQMGAARLLSPTGTMVAREDPQKPWQVVKQGDILQPGVLLVCAGDTLVESLSGSVRVSLVEDLSERVSGTSPFPVIETAVIFHREPKADLGFTLDRGRVLISSVKKDGPVSVSIRAAGEEWRLSLQGEESQVAVETFGRWACAQDFIKDAGPDHAPCQDVIFLVLKGEASLSHRGTFLALHAPPGPAYVQWEKNGGGQIRSRRLEKLPEWTRDLPEGIPDIKKDPETARRLRQLTLQKGLDAALDEFLHSDRKEERTLGVYASAALDDLPRLGKILTQSRHPDLWEHTVLALRHWIGRGPGQDQKLYKGLVASGNFTPIEAEILLHLLHSFDENEVRQPETYEVLIEYLRHPKIGIRGLAHWHLVRLAPEGASIKYHPLDSEEDRERAYQEWKKLIPDGKLPAGQKR